MTGADIKELVVLSGKGGTGKTSIVGSFAELAKDAVFCDCDVDAANLGLLLRPETKEAVEFRVSSKANIDGDVCTGCGECEEICRFGAIRSRKTSANGNVEETGDAQETANGNTEEIADMSGKEALNVTRKGSRANEISPDQDRRPKFEVDLMSCEGCSLCERICPVNAITMKEVVSGHWYVSDSRHGPLIHARLEPGEENSGRLVAAVRQKAREIAQQQGKSLIITDGPPGIGCPVIASLSGADVALIVTEPTLSGIHDLERVVQVCKHFDVPVMVCINRWDINPGNTSVIQKTSEEAGHKVIGLVPYDDTVPKAMVNGLAVTAYDCPAGNSIKGIWQKIEREMQTQARK
ncbi:MAG TPA: 4Fe-4S binding protein [Firmicutes bacterium]|nr:4Fe-4S binding protein [Candidatus Fermentithermobacillaceae bacterium]